MGSIIDVFNNPGGMRMVDGEIGTLRSYLGEQVYHRKDMTQETKLN